MERRERIGAKMLGKTVRVVVDRPIGYRHGDMVYPIHYGYIPGMIAPDGEEQDAYILGITEPVSDLEGIVIAVIHRADDCEDKLVVAPEGQVFHQGQIAEAVRFQEQYFSTTVESIFQKSCGVIPYRKAGEEREFLILLQRCNSWSFPKGHMEAGETQRQTAERELYEETGLRIDGVLEAPVVLEYDITPVIRKQVVLFPAEVSGEVTVQPSEIADYRWVKAWELEGYLHPDTYAACKERLEAVPASACLFGLTKELLDDII